MTVGEVRNPWVVYPIGADWEWHVQNNFQGGTDRRVPPNIPVRSAVDGYATAANDRLNTITVTMNDGTGRQIVHMENKRLVGTFPRHVKAGQQIAVTGLIRANPAGKVITRWPHTHAVVRGNRVRFESLLSQPTSSKPAAPIHPQQQEHPMFEMIYWQVPTGTVWAVIGCGYFEQINRLDTARTRKAALGLTAPSRAVSKDYADLAKQVAERQAQSPDLEGLAKKIAAQINVPTKGTINLTQ